MFITNDYELEYDSQTGIRKVISNMVFTCRTCGKQMKVRDHCRRSWIQKGGRKEWISIRRLYCACCKTYERELPDIMVPFKHYDSAIITGVLDEFIDGDTLGYENTPSDSTIKHWNFWFMRLKEKVVLCKKLNQIHENDRTSNRWLSVLISHLCNSKQLSVV